ncbi:hypothetical protein DH2020_049413 [Rehmannia glutinosa]|uniref:Uncharacterized protein n=1 Tax=Rehmannia glutinosa TaxID=99300 RepID=A0ABR0U3L8_REHGL
MKRGRNEEKMTGPMFPRVHVNDTDKGGPKGPPRNKMAFYEHVTIPSQRSTNATANLGPPLSQEVSNERAVFFSYQHTNRHQSEKQYAQYSDLSNTLTQDEQRKKSDEDDFRVPIFLHSVPNQECDEKMAMLENNMKLEGKIQKEENLKMFLTDRVKGVSTSSTVKEAEALYKQTDSSMFDGPRDISIVKRNSSTSVKSEEQNILHDISNDTETQDGPCRSKQTRNLERGDSVSENSVVGSISGQDMTPDDVVGVIGQKHFWKARREIAKQQRVFAVQVFELHRLIKVQRLIAASPHLLLEDSTYLAKPMKPLPAKTKPLNHPVREIPYISKQKDEPEKPSHKNESSAEKASSSCVLPPQNRGGPASESSPAPSINSNYNSGPWSFTPPQANHWLIPVMSLSEGLVYKPYPGPAFVGSACGGCGGPGLGPNPPMGNFLNPAYGIPAPSFPPAGPYGYFPPYGMPITNISAFSGSSVKQMNGPTIPNQISAGEINIGIQNRNRASPDGFSEDIEVQASISSSPVERLQERKSMEEINVLPLFPTSPLIDDGPNASGPELDRPTQVIKVVPHNARSACESAARIFQAIQEGRKQYDST